MPVTRYKSSDVGSPGNMPATMAAGSYLTILDACLVNGYSGKPGAGWTIAYTATNKRVYRMGGWPYAYLRVDNTAAKARVKMYKSMTGIDTGTDLTPTEAQSSGGYWLRDNGAQSNTRDWVLYANEFTFWFLYSTTSGGSGSIYSGANAYNPSWLGAGRFRSFVPNDPYPIFLSAHFSDVYNAQAFRRGIIACGTCLGSTANGTLPGPQYPLISSSYPLWASAPTATQTYAFGMLNQQHTGPGIPSVINNAFSLYPLTIWENYSGRFDVRGTLPGLWEGWPGLPYNVDHVFSSGPLAGKTVNIQAVGCSDYGGYIHIEASNTWEY